MTCLENVRLWVQSPSNLHVASYIPALSPGTFLQFFNRTSIFAHRYVQVPQIKITFIPVAMITHSFIEIQCLLGLEPFIALSHTPSCWEAKNHL